MEGTVDFWQKCDRGSIALRRSTVFVLWNGNAYALLLCVRMDKALGRWVWSPINGRRFPTTHRARLLETILRAGARLLVVRSVHAPRSPAATVPSFPIVAWSRARWMAASANLLAVGAGLHIEPFLRDKMSHNASPYMHCGSSYGNSLGDCYIKRLRPNGGSADSLIEAQQLFSNVPHCEDRSQATGVYAAD
jgi:hypothetical protein